MAILLTTKISEKPMGKWSPPAGIFFFFREKIRRAHVENSLSVSTSQKRYEFTSIYQFTLVILPPA